MCAPLGYGISLDSTLYESCVSYLHKSILQTFPFELCVCVTTTTKRPLPESTAPNTKPK